MAHFHKMPNGQRISTQTITVPGSTITIGLWGYLDFSRKELFVDWCPQVGINLVRKGIVGNSRLYELKGSPGKKTRVEALASDGAEWDWCEIEFIAAGGKTYTSNPREVLTRRTTPTPLDVVNMLLASWSELTANGARTLTAQFMAETGGGRYCFNWNLGNVKSGPNELHMYLHGVWEVDSPHGAQAQVARANGLAHIATADEVKKHGWGCPPGKAIAVFEPPHPQCRFRAYGSLQDGSQRWLLHHQAIARRDINFLTALNAGNSASLTH